MIKTEINCECIKDPKGAEGLYDFQRGGKYKAIHMVVVANGREYYKLLPDPKSDYGNVVPIGTFEEFFKAV